MRVREYLKNMKKDSLTYYEVTFIRTLARKDSNTPFYHPEYITTPIHSVDRWLEGNNTLLDDIILNDKQMSIDWLSGAQWGRRIQAGYTKCILIISEEDFSLLYSSADQRRSIEEFIEDKLDKNF